MSHVIGSEPVIEWNWLPPGVERSTEKLWKVIFIIILCKILIDIYLMNILLRHLLRNQNIKFAINSLILCLIHILLLIFFTPKMSWFVISINTKKLKSILRWVVIILPISISQTCCSKSLTNNVGFSWLSRLWIKPARQWTWKIPNGLITKSVAVGFVVRIIMLH